MERIGKVRFPIFAIMAAIPRAVRAAKEAAADDHDPDSPGGETVTPGEVAEVVAAFVAALGEAVLPEVLAVNNHFPKKD